MLSLQYTPSGPICCWGSNLVEQASGVVLEEQDVMAMVEQVVEVEQREESCTGASTAIVVHSIEVVVEHENETNEQQVEYGIEVDMTKGGVRTRKDEWGNPKKVCEWIGWGCNMFWISLASPIGKVWNYVASFS